MPQYVGIGSDINRKGRKDSRKDSQRNQNFALLCVTFFALFVVTQFYRNRLIDTPKTPLYDRNTCQPSKPLLVTNQ